VHNWTHRSTLAEIVQPLRPIDPVVTFRNSQGEAARGTLTSVQRRCLVMEIYNPYSIVQVSEVLTALTVRSGDKSIYQGKAVVVSLVNTGLMAVVSVSLTDEWSEFNAIRGDLTRVPQEASRFVEDWEARFRINRSYQVIISEFRAFLSEASKWADQADMSDVMPRDQDGRIREDVFYDLAEPIMRKGGEYLSWLEDEGSKIPSEESVAHRNFAQTALHPLLLRAPFVYRTFAKPLGYAGDYEMVNQILTDPRQGNSTYFQIINTLFLKAAVAQAHRNRIDILVDHLNKAAERARLEQRQISVLNVGCGPAIEIRRFIVEHPQPHLLSFTLLDFSQPTIDYTRARIDEACARERKQANVEFVNESVHDLLKRASKRGAPQEQKSFDLVYCAGLYDYLSDKVCTRLLQYFVSRTNPGGEVLVTNVHSNNPQKVLMEHLLEWHLIYRDEAQFESLLPASRANSRVYTDETGANVFADFIVPAAA
jgi:extracellular factor (EF) 3-hydroxypalmitic acid methyl ester biosynthesis protein